MEPLLLTTPPKIGSRHPLDLLDQLKLAWRMRGLDVGRVGELTRLMTMSAWDLLDDWFESPQVKGAMAVDGIIGTWAGPATPGTAYVLMHHEIGDAGLGLSSWGYPRGRYGGRLRRPEEFGEAFGAEVRTNAPVERILQKDGRVTGVVLEGGEELEADIVVAATHPRITFLEQLGREELPEEFVGSIERWNSRSGVVKINLALSELPRLQCRSRSRGAPRRGRRAGPLHRLHRGGLPGCAAREPARRPFSDGVIPTVFDRTLCPEGYHIMSLFTQWVPHEWSEEPHREELEAYADRVIDGYGELAPNLKGPSCTARCSVLTTWSRRSGSSGATSSTASSRPSSSSTCGRPRATRTTGPHPGPLPGLVGHPRRWRCLRHPGVQLRAGDPARPAQGAPEATPDPAQPRITRWR